VLGPFHAMPPAGYGAVEKVWHDLARTFAAKGHSVCLMGKGGAPGPAGNLTTVTLRGFCASRWLLLNLAMDLRYAAQVLRALPRADVIVTNSFWTPVLLTMFARRLGRVVVHVARFPQRQMGLYRRAAILQAVSTVVADEIVRQAPGLRDKVRMLPNPIDLATFHPPREARHHDGDLTVLYVGRIHPEKGLAILIRAARALMADLRGLRLRIVGPWAVDRGGGGPEYLRSLKEAAGDAPIEFVDPVRDPRALAEEYRRAHCFCYPSLAEKGEASPMAPLEAMATGLPVVVSDLKCFGDYLVPGENGLAFDHRGPAPERALAAALAQVLRDPQTALRLGRSAAERARDFDLDAVANRYLDLFAQVLKKDTR